MTVVVPGKRLFSTTTYIFIMWMVGTSLVLFAVASVFMRNQVRPISRLAHAADQFGKGRDLDMNFKPEGAQEVRQAASAFNEQPWLFIVASRDDTTEFQRLLGCLVEGNRAWAGKAPVLMLAVASLLFLPALAEGSLFGQRVVGAVAPVGVSVLVGAFLFGVGMQLGGGCASGTLYTVGGGSTRMIVTLFGFIAGSVLGAWNLPVWDDLPRIGAFSLLENFGLSAALASNLALLAGVVVFSIWIERIRHRY